MPAPASNPGTGNSEHDLTLVEEGWEASGLEAMGQVFGPQVRLVVTSSCTKGFGFRV